MTALPAPPLRSAARLLLTISALAALAGCATRDSYPSLAPRPVEGSAASGAAEASTQSVPVDAALEARVATLVKQVVDGHAAFEQAVTQACPAITRGARAGEGSEPWIAAQQAISVVDAARAPVLSAVAELDRLVIERGTAGGAPVDLGQLAAAQEQASAIDAAEQATVAKLPAGNCAG
jgi:hypothetical protein